MGRDASKVPWGEEEGCGKRSRFILWGIDHSRTGKSVRRKRQGKQMEGESLGLPQINPRGRGVEGITLALNHTLKSVKKRKRWKRSWTVGQKRQNASQLHSLKRRSCRTLCSCGVTKGRGGAKRTLRAGEHKGKARKAGRVRVDERRGALSTRSRNKREKE